MDGRRPLFRSRGSRGKLRTRRQLAGAPKERVDEPTTARRRKRNPRALAREHREEMTPAPRCARRTLLLFFAACAVGCNQRAIESWLSQSDGPEATGYL